MNSVSAEARSRSHRQARWTVCLAACLLLQALGAAAQESTGGIRGIVRDSSGGVLVGVTVEAVSPARLGGPAVDVTNTRGLYRLDGLPIGVYRVTFTLQGVQDRASGERAG